MKLIHAIMSTLVKSIVISIMGLNIIFNMNISIEVFRYFYIGYYAIEIIVVISTLLSLLSVFQGIKENKSLITKELIEVTKKEKEDLKELKLFSSLVIISIIIVFSILSNEKFILAITVIHFSLLMILKEYLSQIYNFVLYYGQEVENEA